MFTVHTLTAVWTGSWQHKVIPEMQMGATACQQLFCFILTLTVVYSLTHTLCHTHTLVPSLSGVNRSFETEGHINEEQGDKKESAPPVRCARLETQVL